MTADYIRALREERAEYVNRGLPDRVAQVDAELARLGAELAPKKRPTKPKE